MLKSGRDILSSLFSFICKYIMAMPEINKTPRMQMTVTNRSYAGLMYSCRSQPCLLSGLT